MTTTHIILASQSPRRRQLLGLLSFPFTVMVTNVDEDLHLELEPAAYVLRTAQQKAEAAVAQLPPIDHTQRLYVLAADTTVALEGRILGKPATPAEARAMLLALRDRAHDVHTAICLVDVHAKQEISRVNTTEVTMRDYSLIEIDTYIDTGDPFDKAGAYAIQHPTFRPVRELAGCYLGVMGLPLCDLVALLSQFDIKSHIKPQELILAHNGFPCPARESLFENGLVQ